MRPHAFLRRAEPRDAAALAALEAASSLHPWNEAQLLAELERPAPDAVLLIEGRDGSLAYGAFRLVLDELHVMNLAVHPDARRRGLARFLLRLGLLRGARAGASRAMLEVRAGNGAARALYAECGFRPLGQRKQYYADPPDDALVLVREGLADRS